MSFFTKLRERLFKSSARLDAALDEVVAAGAESGDEAAAAPAPGPET
ncbi:MAG: signal recognition particle-docking protein FtsY, partial [Rhodobacteraceae bacterium]|nr:signal recognition particle-docking protein FtsY [Paracoccaceae bacterium]